MKMYGNTQGEVKLMDFIFIIGPSAVGKTWC